MKHAANNRNNLIGNADGPPRSHRSNLNWFALLILAATFAVAGTARAQLPVPGSSQFSIVGFLHNATLDNPANILSGGTVVVNGQQIIVPANTIVEMPAAALTWQEIFAKAPAPYGIPGQPGVTATVPETGMSLDDTNGTPAPLSTYEFSVVGNRVITATGDDYIAALIYLSQASLNGGSGYINFIDYANAEIRVGGKMAPGGANVIADPRKPGVRVRINDPIITDPNDVAFGPLDFVVPADRQEITATATDPAGNTSEFSTCFQNGIFSDSFEGI